ncbi:hypothetical protein [Nocardiopsis coralliicola]
MDPVTLVIGAAIALGGVAVGRLLPRRERPEARRALPEAPPQPAPQPICGCGHHLVFHDQESKLCQAQIIIPDRWTTGDRHPYAGQEGVYRQCKCQGYRGPVPVDEYYAPDLFNGGA